MEVAAAWAGAPLVVALLCAGHGLLLERLTGQRLPGALVVPAGFAALVVVLAVPASFRAIAPLAVPLAVVAAAGGLAGWRPRADPRLRAAAWPAAAGLAAFGVHAAPSLLSGQGSLTGYVTLDDAATWLALLDHALDRGRDLAGVAPGTHRRVLESWLAAGYPVGALLPVGAAARLSGQDAAAAFQPVLAACAAVAALGLVACVRPLAGSRAAAAGVGLLGVQASLAYGYAQWGGLKEVAAVALLPVLAWTAVHAVRAPQPGPLALLLVAAGALGAAFGVTAAAWVAVPVLVAGLAAVRRAPRIDGRFAIATTGVAALATLAFLPVLGALDFARQTADPGGGVARQDDLGNLLSSLPLAQGLGLWPAGDFRLASEPPWLGPLLALACAAAAGAAVGLALRRREPVLPVLVGLAAAGAVPAVVLGSPWIDAKALAILAPFVLAAAGTLVAAGMRSTARPAAVAGAVLLAAATAWSTALVARDVDVAPRARLDELREVARLAGVRGPLAVLDFDPYAARHALRDAAPEGVTDLRERPVLDLAGRPFPRLGGADTDAIAPPSLAPYRLLVRRRNPVASRPPAAFLRLWAGSQWEAWERDPAAPAVLDRLALGKGLDPASAPACDAVRALARTPGTRALAAAPRSAIVLADLGAATAGVPPPWRTPEGVRPVVDGEAAVALDVPATAVWRVWVGGSVRGRLDVAVDGRPAGTRRHELAYDGQWLRLGAVRLTAGRHVVQLRHTRGGPLRAGRGRLAEQAPLGPVALTPVAEEAGVRIEAVAPRDWRRLCGGRRLDWVEALTAPPPGASMAAG